MQAVSQYLTFQVRLDFAFNWIYTESVQCKALLSQAAAASLVQAGGSLKTSLIFFWEFHPIIQWSWKILNLLRKDTAKVSCYFLLKNYSKFWCTSWEKQILQTVNAICIYIFSFLSLITFISHIWARVRDPPARAPESLCAHKAEFLNSWIERHPRSFISKENSLPLPFGCRELFVLEGWAGNKEVLEDFHRFYGLVGLENGKNCPY